MILGTDIHLCLLWWCENLYVSTNFYLSLQWWCNTLACEHELLCVFAVMVWDTGMRTQTVICVYIEGVRHWHEGTNFNLCLQRWCEILACEHKLLSVFAVMVWHIGMWTPTFMCVCCDGVRHWHVSINFMCVCCDGVRHWHVNTNFYLSLQWWCETLAWGHKF